MQTFFALTVAILSSYIIGSIPTSFIMAKVLKGIDIRRAGSGNIGATNVYRVIGKLPGFITLIIDIFKGVLVVTLVANFFYSFMKNFDYGLYRTILGLVAICGHIWTVFLNFRGGKGVATTIGVMIIIAPKVLLASILIWLIVFSLTNYVSLASISMGVAFPISAGLLNQPFYIIIFTVTICILTSYKHKDNIRRLLKGEENKTVIFGKR